MSDSEVTKLISGMAIVTLSLARNMELHGVIPEGASLARPIHGGRSLSVDFMRARVAPEIGDSSLTLVLPPKTARNLAQELHKLLDQALWDDD